MFDTFLSHKDTCKCNTIKILITAPKKIIQDTTYNTIMYDEKVNLYVYTLMEKGAYWCIH